MLPDNGVVAHTQAGYALSEIEPRLPLEEQPDMAEERYRTKSPIRDDETRRY
jgi:hypothetical protein